MYNLTRFLAAQEATFSDAYWEIKNGKKTSHWMWFIFPQPSGLGDSSTSKFYEIVDLVEAEQYLAHPVLGKRLIEISTILVEEEYQKTAKEIFGYPDDLKLRSSMTLFHVASKDDNSVFRKVILKYLNGAPDAATLALLQKNQICF